MQQNAQDDNNRTVHQLVSQLCQRIVPLPDDKQSEKIHNRLKHKCFSILLDMDEKFVPSGDTIDQQQIDFKLSCAIYRLNCQQRPEKANQLLQLSHNLRKFNFIVSNVHDTSICSFTSQLSVLSLLMHLANLDRQPTYEPMFFNNVLGSDQQQTMSGSEDDLQRKLDLNRLASTNRFITSIREHLVDDRESNELTTSQSLNDSHSMTSSTTTVSLIPFSEEYEEYIQSIERPIESIYFTEYGEDKLYLNRQYFSLFEEESRLVSEETLINNAILVMQGIPSSLFQYNEEECRFVPVLVHTKSCSADSIHGMVLEFAQIGSMVKRLDTFSQYYEFHPKQSGVICRAFATAVGSFTRWYLATMLSMKEILENNIITKPQYRTCSETPRLSLVSLLLHVEPIITRLKFVAKLCWCDPQPLDDQDRFDQQIDPRDPRSGFISKRIQSFPKGGSLLSYLYERTVDSEFYDDIRSLAFFMYKAACDPYLKWIRDWIYFGVLSDQFDEFFIQRTAIASDSTRGDNIWRQGFNMYPDRVPCFLDEVAGSIYQIGRTIDVIRRFDPSHFVFTHYPTITEKLFSVECTSNSINRIKNRYTRLAVLHNGEHEKFISEQIKAEELLFQRQIQQALVNQNYMQEVMMMHNEKMLQLATERAQHKRALLQQQLEEISERRERKRQEEEQRMLDHSASFLALPSMNNLNAQNMTDEEKEFARIAEAQIRGEYSKKMAAAQRRIEVARWQYKRHLLVEKRKVFNYEQFKDIELSGVQESPQQPFLTIEETSEDKISQGTADVNLPAATSAAPDSTATSALASDNTVAIRQPTDTATMLVNTEDTMVDDEELITTRPPTVETAEKDADDDLVMVESLTTSQIESENAPQRDADESDEFIGDAFDEPEPDLSMEEICLKPSDQTLPFELAVRESVTKPVMSHFDTLGTITRSLIFNTLKIHEHLAAVQRYFLLQAGDFANLFAGMIFERLHQYGLNQASEVNNILQEALKRSEYIERDSRFVDRLSFDVKPITDNRMIDIYSIDAFDHVALNYAVEFPLDIVFNQSAMDKYNRIYNFLMRLKRVELMVGDIWTQFKHASTRRSFDVRITKLQLFRQEIQHFMTIMQSYIMTLLSTCTKEFEQQLAKADSFQSVIELHDEYLGRILSQCLLNPGTKDIMQIIQAIMNLILKFRLQLLNNPLSQPLSPLAFNAMMQTKHDFQQRAQYLYSVLKRVKTASYEAIDDYNPNPLTLLLNYNHFYET